jgi:methanogenic corrinoid protein MtbC1
MDVGLGRLAQVAPPVQGFLAVLDADDHIGSHWASAFLEAAQKEKADIVGLSALMTTALPAQKRPIHLFSEVGLRQQFKLIIGGGATNQSWADEIGADGYAPDAAAAVDLCKRLLDQPSSR